LSIEAIILPPTGERNFDKVKHGIGGFPLAAMHHLDDLDVRIIKELGSPSSLQWNVRETYSGIAKRVGIDEETVRRRLKRAEERGSLPGWRVMVNPKLIGCEAATIDLDVADETGKDTVIGAIRRVDGVIKILDFRGKGLQITVYYPNENALKRRMELISSICGSSEATVWQLSFPSPNIRMTNTDWKIIGNMLDDARKSLSEVSHSITVSTRTVERRLTAMQNDFVVYLQGTPNFSRVAGLSCVFLVFIPDAKRKRGVDRAVLSRTPRTELANTSSKQYSTFVMLFENLSEADDFTNWIMSLQGVESVKMGVMRGLVVVQDWLRDEIQKRIEVGERA
jgi:DNA-binding Lrp family transcriptional regulator